ncbi:hypothetical protein CLAFUW4_13779 [Fulvia fulva]|nr:hypothetical protein CLAFUR4_13782 [Fulvia fulva]KAK4611322.1 hypothetical protein CLAFUR0_13786 [Fulvia fulva]WPV22118.1 hypothetical protein CLAFUW4_13779 [Fulvia fulva]
MCRHGKNFAFVHAQNMRDTQRCNQQQPRASDKRGGRLHNYRVTSLGTHDSALAAYESGSVARRVSLYKTA